MPGHSVLYFQHPHLKHDLKRIFLRCLCQFQNLSGGGDPIVRAIPVCPFVHPHFFQNPATPLMSGDEHTIALAYWRNYKLIKLCTPDRTAPRDRDRGRPLYPHTHTHYIRHPAAGFLTRSLHSPHLTLGRYSPPFPSFPSPLSSLLFPLEVSPFHSRLISTPTLRLGGISSPSGSEPGREIFVINLHAFDCLMTNNFVYVYC